MDAFNLPDVLPFKVNYRLKREAVVKNLLPIQEMQET